MSPTNEIFLLTFIFSAFFQEGLFFDPEFTEAPAVLTPTTAALQAQAENPFQNFTYVNQSIAAQAVLLDTT